MKNGRAQDIFAPVEKAGSLTNGKSKFSWRVSTNEVHETGIVALILIMRRDKKCSLDEYSSRRTNQYHFVAGTELFVP